MIESKLYKKLDKALKGMSIDLQRIESGGIGLGIPDVSYQSPNVGGWIELKRVTSFNKGIIEIPFRPGQLSWIRRRTQVGGICWVVLTDQYNKEVIFILNPRERIVNLNSSSIFIFRIHFPLCGGAILSLLNSDINKYDCKRANS